ncbi:anthrone oxygenase family protein [Psychrobacillus sp. L4]|uniref:anthrone oxygenase family protein n=1 Tax=Psychrobacillus sp. L4 TaxID=3236892 RepID=UPI0036F3839C
MAFGVATLFFDGTGLVLGFRWAGVFSLIILMLITLIGTVPINKGILDWRFDAPPNNWKLLIRRWERLDVFRSSAAILAFAFFLVAMVLHLTGN